MAPIRLQKEKSQEKNVSSFIAQFERTVEFISFISLSDEGSVFKKILYMSVLDALSKTTSQNNQNNREQFVEFVKSHCSWNDSNRISFTHLQKLLVVDENSILSELRDYVSSKSEGWEKQAKNGIHVDPELSEIEKYWPHIGKVAEVKLTQITHAHLLYTYRNFLIHETRPPGDSVELLGEEEIPHYQQHGKDNQRWELVYPENFLKTLVKNALRSLSVYLNDQRIDPYSKFTFSSYWIAKLKNT